MCFNLLKLLLIASFFSLPAFSSGISKKDCLLSVLNTLEDKKVKLDPGIDDTAIEIELQMTPNVMDILTTTDGTLKPILGDVIPDEVLAWAKKKRISKDILPVTKWEILPYDLKRKLLSTPESDDFGGDNWANLKKVIGLKTKNKVLVNFKEETTLFGKKYGVGKKEINLKSIFGTVEHMSIKSRARFGGVELHVRSPLEPGTVSEDTWKLLDLLKIEKPNEHLHTLGRLPIKLLKKDPELEAARVVDYWTRLNLYYEMKTLREGKGLKIRTLSTKSGFDQILFRPLGNSQVKDAMDALIKSPKTGSFLIGDDAKFAYVGLRGWPTYDEKSILAFEFRKVKPKGDSKLNSRVFSGAKKALNSWDFGKDPLKLKEWLELKKAEGLTAAVAMQGSYYDTILDLRTCSKQVRDYMDEIRAKQIANGETSHGLPLKPFNWEKEVQYTEDNIHLLRSDNLELDMLRFDWGRMPYLAGNSKLLEKIGKAQVIALKKIMLKTESNNQIMNDFLDESGLFDEIQNSIVP